MFFLWLVPLLQLLVAPSSAQLNSDACDTCVCSGTSVSCVDLHLTTLPSNVPNDTQSLNLTRNMFEHLPDNMFSSLTSLVTLDLSNNIIESVDSLAFAGLSRLEFLSMSLNGFTTLPAEVFGDLLALRVLFMDRTYVDSLPSTVFRNLRQLQFLDLTYGRLQTLPEDIFNENNVLDVWLHSHPWHCNCSLAPIHAKALQSTTALVFPVCDTPSPMHDRSWSEITPEELCGLPPATRTSTTTTTTTTTEATIESTADSTTTSVPEVTDDEATSLQPNSSSEATPSLVQHNDDLFIWVAIIVVLILALAFFSILTYKIYKGQVPGFRKQKQEKEKKVVEY